MAKVLVVDDDAGIRSAARRVLVAVGHEVWDVPGGTEALPLLDVIPFDLIITDVYMEAVDGMELLLRVQQMGLRIPIVVITGGGYASADDILDMAKNCGAAETLDKPFTPRQLRETVARALAGG
jgi:DNA-binding NtrC family response regulator